jgi:hypothetical protein
MLETGEEIKHRERAKERQKRSHQTLEREREFFIGNLLVRVHYDIIVILIRVQYHIIVIS